MTLRSLALASVATVALSTGASLAADLPMRTAAPAPMYAAVPVFTWTGFYVGVQAGGVWGRGDATDAQGPGLAAATQTFNLRNDGFLGGLHAGYNFQLSQSWVFGFEVEGNFGSADGTVRGPNRDGAGVILATGGVLMQRDLNWMASARARLGYLITPHTLLYIAGGVTAADHDYAGTHTYTVPVVNQCPGVANCSRVSFGDTSFGWNLGAGLEMHLTSNWRVRAEYLYHRLEGKTATALPTFNVGPNRVDYRFDDTTYHVARVGLSYAFGRPAAPILARY